MARKKNQQVYLSTRSGLDYRIRALKSQHPFLRHLKAKGLASTIEWIVDWAIPRLWRNVKNLTIQQIIAEKLSEPGHPWSEASDPMDKFADAAMLDRARIEAVIDGVRPDPEECSAIAAAIGMDIDDFMDVVEEQYRDDGDEDEDEEDVLKGATDADASNHTHGD